jgi:glyoxylase-like metal-dependent hydrolase (beta-lactamase superfamily II)
VFDEKTSEGFLVDPGSDAEKIGRKAAEKGVKIRAILLTHGHFDHALSAEYFQKKGAKVYIHRADAYKLTEKNDIGRFFGVKYSPFFADCFFETEEETLEICGMKIKVIHTPGHSKGGVCYYFEDEKLIFSGDTLFFGDIGRTDLEGGDFFELKNSILKKIFALPDDTAVYPGHDGPTTVGSEKNNKNLFNG